MDTFDSRIRHRSLQDVADLTGLPRSTVHRILDQLAEVGWVYHSPSGYSLGWRVAQHASSAGDHALLREAAAPVVHDLALRSGLVVHLAILDGPFITYLDKVGGAYASRLPSRVGGRLPAHYTALGEAMLAYSVPEDLERDLGQAAQVGAISQIDLPELFRELGRIRMRGGIAIHSRQHFTDLICIGAPVFNAEGKLAGAISLCDAGGTKNVTGFAPQLRNDASKISRRLARSGPASDGTRPGSPMTATSATRCTVPSG